MTPPLPPTPTPTVTPETRLQELLRVHAASLELTKAFSRAFSLFLLINSLRRFRRADHSSVLSSLREEAHRIVEDSTLQQMAGLAELLADPDRVETLVS